MKTMHIGALTLTQAERGSGVYIVTGKGGKRVGSLWRDDYGSWAACRHLAENVTEQLGSGSPKLEKSARFFFRAHIGD